MFDFISQLFARKRLDCSLKFLKGQGVQNKMDSGEFILSVFPSILIARVTIHLVLNSPNTSITHYSSWLLINDTCICLFSKSKLNDPWTSQLAEMKVKTVSFRRMCNCELRLKWNFKKLGFSLLVNIYLNYIPSLIETYYWEMNDLFFSRLL